jgi:hypothetical protein
MLWNAFYPHALYQPIGKVNHAIFVVRNFFYKHAENLYL